MVSFKITDSVRALVEKLSETLTQRRGEKYTLTDVIEEGIKVLAKKEKVE